MRATSKIRPVLRMFQPEKMPDIKNKEEQYFEGLKKFLNYPFNSPGNFMSKISIQGNGKQTID